MTARLNARLNGVRINAHRGDLYAPVGAQRFDLIVSNPPYVPCDTRGGRAYDAGPDGRAFLDRLIAQAPDHLRRDGCLLIVSSSILGTERTLRDMAAAGLSPEVIARQRGPLGPLMQARVKHLEASGLLAPGQRHEDVVVIRGRKPAPAGWKSPGHAPEGLFRPTVLASSDAGPTSLSPRGARPPSPQAARSPTDRAAS
jgi:release factor glutamine methyltransferase